VCRKGIKQAHADQLNLFHRNSHFFQLAPEKNLCTQKSYGIGIFRLAFEALLKKRDFSRYFKADMIVATVIMA
jgi:hypothetical protein